jgi:ectoine hydroxylase-related dioxygenase (phytanoyl-CoA dioxygenase family)
MKSEGYVRFENNGFEILPDVLPREQCDALAKELSSLYEQRSTNRKVGGVRNLLKRSPQVADVASSPAITALLQVRLQILVFPVRAIFFDKTPGANWGVPWHQDLSIAVSERKEAPGFGGWSLKNGVHHVQAPRETLESMATLRLHLDDCDADNGALRVIPGSHRKGKLSDGEVAACTRDTPQAICEVTKGDAVMMRPLLLHSSSPAKQASHRRVLHIEYGTDELPHGLVWFNH